MKYILSIILFIFTLFSFSFVWNTVEAWFITWWWNVETPYCRPGDKCWIKEWVDAIKDIDAIEKDKKASDYVQNVVKFILWFLALIATLLVIYAWFNLLTWVWDEEKAKKSKQIILYVILWTLIVFIAGPLVDFVLWILQW